MTTEATRARQLALACEAKKHAYRQTQDGVVVSFVLHPQEVPDELATAPLGQRYQLALVALNDDDTPREGMVQHTGPRSIPATRLNNAQPARAKRSWDEMTPAQQAGMLRNDQSFGNFVREHWGQDEEPKELIYRWCNVSSNAHIAIGTPAHQKWDDLVSRYRAWMREPSVVPG